MPGQKERVVWDKSVTGLGKRIRPGVVDTWIYQHRVAGRTRKVTVGRCSEIDLETARRLANAVGVDALQLDCGDDSREENPTISEFAERYIDDCAGYWKPATVKSNRLIARVRIVPALGDRALSSIEASDVRVWHSALTASRSPGTADRSLAVLSGMMRHAEVLGLRPRGSNPCRGLRRRKTTFKAHVLSEPEWAQLGEALLARRNAEPVLVALVYFIAMTGCRRGEALSLRWDWIQEGRAILPDSKTGPRVIWLGEPVQRLLLDIPRTVSPLVFPGARGASIDSALTRFWNELRGAAQVSALRVHDLRHSFATLAIEIGQGEKVLAGLLGHSDLGTTAAYVHLAEKPVYEAAEKVGAHLNQALGQAPLKQERRPRITTTELGAKNKVATRTVQPLGKEALYFRSGLSFPEFCQKHNLNPQSFRRRVIAARSAMKKRAGGKSNA